MGVLDGGLHAEITQILVAAPVAVSASLNWTWTESFPVELFCARIRSQTW